MSRTIDYAPLFDALRGTALEPWLARLPAAIEAGLDPKRFGDLPEWLAALDALPDVAPSSVDLNAPGLAIGSEDDCGAATRAALRAALMRLHPWRKGPFDLFGMRVDAEWRSDRKWDRISPHLAPLHGRTVLDVGCGSGYHCFRMLGAGASRVVGVDVKPLYAVQFEAIRRYAGPHLPAWVLPVGVDDVPEGIAAFDTVFSMGVLYHRRSPIDHLRRLRSLLRPGGELVVETLVIEGDVTCALVPEGRYAQMRNVWFIPSPAMLERWLARCGFARVRCVDLTPTTSGEQRATEWMHFHSLVDFLDPRDSSRTVEGYPAPLRATLLADA